MCLDCELLRTQNESLTLELTGAVEGYEIESSNRRKAEREAHRLKRELNGSTSKESLRVRDLCDYHAEAWKRAYPRATGLDYMMDGKNAAAFRKVIRWGKPDDEIREVIDGAFASDFHRKTPRYLYPTSFLADENRYRDHLLRSRAERADALLDEGLKQVRETLNNRLVQPVDRVLMALEAQDLKWRAAGPYVWLSSCPVCAGVLRVDERPNGWAKVRCEQDCDWWLLLDALRLWPTDLTLPSDPGVVWAPLIEDCPVKVHQLPAPSSVPFAVAA